MEWQSVLGKVNRLEDGLACSVFLCTMIHINNVAHLPYSPFILFPSLPFDIPSCFHLQNLANYRQEPVSRTQRAEGRRPLFSGEQNWAMIAQHKYVDDSVCAYMLGVYMETHRHTESHAHIPIHTNRSTQIQIWTQGRTHSHGNTGTTLRQHWSYNLLLFIKPQGYWSNHSICRLGLLPNC